MAKASDGEIERIANDIFDLVERVDGPVTLNDIDDSVSGFFKPKGPAYSYVVGNQGSETTFWYNMTEVGYLALQRVLNDHRVAVQLVTSLPYLLEGICITDKTWQPIILLPARAANLETPTFLTRATPAVQKYILASGKVGYRSLRPLPVRFTADCFCSV
jgi:hypothetical protein